MLALYGGILTMLREILDAYADALGPDNLIGLIALKMRLMQIVQNREMAGIPQEEQTRRGDAARAFGSGLSRHRDRRGTDHVRPLHVPLPPSGVGIGISKEAMMVWMMLVFALALGAFAVPIWWCLVLPVTAAVLSTVTHDGTRSIVVGKVLSEKNYTGGAGTFLRAATVYLVFYVPLSFALFFIGRWFLA